METIFDNITTVAIALIWASTLIWGLHLLKRPLSDFLSGLGHRITKFSAFDISIELAALPASPDPWSVDSGIQEGSEMLGGDVTSTTLKEFFERVKSNESLEFLIVDVKDGRFWFVSRLYIYTIFLQAMLGLKSVVFVESRGITRRRLLGISSPERVRKTLGQTFPWFEKSFENAVKKHPNYTYPKLSPFDAAKMIEGFLEDDNMQLNHDPGESTKETSVSSIQPEEWVKLGEKEKWEHTYCLDLEHNLVSTAIAKTFHKHDESHITVSPDQSNEERIKAVLARKSPYVALVNSKGEFEELVDRQKLAALVGEALIKRTNRN